MHKSEVAARYNRIEQCITNLKQTCLALLYNLERL